jgi:hypothetical protein
MAEEEMLVKSTNKVGTQIYYLGHFATQALDRTTLPDKDARQNQFLESINIRTDNGHRVRNNRQNITRTSSSNKRPESSASKKGSKKSSVTPSAKKSKLNPKLSLFTSDEESSIDPTDAPSKDKDGALITVNLPVTTSLNNLTIVLPVTKSLKIPTIALPVTKNLKNPTIPHPN